MIKITIFSKIEFRQYLCQDLTKIKITFKTLMINEVYNINEIDILGTGDC